MNCDILIISELKQVRVLVCQFFSATPDVVPETCALSIANTFFAIIIELVSDLEDAFPEVRISRFFPHRNDRLIFNIFAMNNRLPQATRIF
jgi:hypothetical protein